MPTAPPQQRRMPPTPIVVLLAAHGFALALLVGGTSFGEIARALTAAALTVDVIAMQRPPRSWFDDAVMMLFGLAGVMAGAAIGVHHAAVDIASVASVSGVACIVAGLPLLVIGARRLVRRLPGWRKLLALPVGAVGFVAAVAPMALAMFVTNAPHYPLGDDTPADLGLEYDDVTVTTADGVDLAAWYIPSSNGAALVQLGGCCAARDDELRYAAVLARHGYGVLMLDQRGHGGSDGDAMLWGWWGELDVAAGVDFLAARPDVDQGRIGAIGMSVGGEQVIAAAGGDARIRAVVAEGVTARGARDEGDPASGMGGVVVRYVDWVTKHAAALMTSAATPTQLRDAVAAMTPEQRVFVINAGTDAAEVAAAGALDAVDPDIVSEWIVPDSGHIEALATHPDEWERRVIGFLDTTL